MTQESNPFTSYRRSNARKSAVMDALLPGELDLVPYPPDGEAFLFGWTTNGLASGNSLDEATLHASFEVLERDAIAMNKARDCSQLVLNTDLPPPFDESRRIGGAVASNSLCATCRTPSTCRAFRPVSMKLRARTLIWR